MERKNARAPHHPCLWCVGGGERVVLPWGRREGGGGWGEGVQRLQRRHAPSPPRDRGPDVPKTPEMRLELGSVNRSVYTSPPATSNGTFPPTSSSHTRRTSSMRNTHAVLTGPAGRRSPKPGQNPVIERGGPARDFTNYCHSCQCAVGATPIDYRLRTGPKRPCGWYAGGG